jgi:hypothetical protein
MWEFITGRQMQRIVVISTIFYILSTAEIYYTDERWWCMLAMIIIIEFLSYGHGMLDGTSNLLDMDRDKLLKIKDYIDDIDQGTDHNEEKLVDILKEKEKKEEMKDD